MPKRSNLLQRTIKLIEESKGDFLTIRESELLPDKETGQLREVDVVLKGSINGHPITISFEIIDRRRKSDSGWVEQMLRKHESLTTDKLILVSGSGFTKPAQLKAELNQVKVLDLSRGDAKLRHFLESAAYIVGVEAMVTCLLKVGDSLEILNSDVELKMGNFCQSATDQAKTLLGNEHLRKVLLETDFEQGNQSYEVRFPHPVTVYGRKPALVEHFDEVIFIVDVKRRQIPVKLSSIDYDGVDFVYGIVDLPDSAFQFVGSIDGELWKSEKIENGDG